MKLFYDLVLRSRRSRRLEGWPQTQCFAAILRDAMLRMAPQDEVRGIKRDVVRSDRFHGIDPLGFRSARARARHGRYGTRRDQQCASTNGLGSAATMA